MALEIRGPRSAVQASLATMLWMFVCFLGAALLIIMIFEKLGASVAFLSESFYVLGAGAALVIAFLSQTLEQAAPKTADLSAPPIFRGLALSADTISVTFFLGVAGAIFALGDDGLAFVLGLASGYLLLQLLVVPRLPKLGTRSMTGIFSELYGGWAPRICCIVIVMVSMAVLLVAQLMGAGLIGARLLGLPFAIAVYLSAGVLAVCFLLNSTAGTPWLRSILYLLLLAAFLFPLVEISAQRYGTPLPQLAYTNALWQVQGLEEALLENQLADPVTLKPTFTSFLSFGPLSFAGIVLGLAAGMASLPSLLTGHGIVGPVRDARRATVWGLVFAAVLLSAAPIYATFAKLELYKLIGGGAELVDLPSWVFTYGKLGLFEICGRPASDATAIVGSCSSINDPTSALRLQDITLSPDSIVLMLPEMAGLGHWVFGLLATSGIAIALATAVGPLRTIVGALGLGQFGIPGNDATTPTPTKLLSYTAVLAVVALAAWAATTRPASILTTTTWAFTLAAAGLFPALVAGLWWKRASARGAGAAMLTGFGVCLYYIVATHYFAVSFVETWGFLSNVGSMGTESLNELKQSWMVAPPGPEKETAWLALNNHAREIANWWGVSNLAAALFAIPVGLIVLVFVSLLTSLRSPKET